jgi:hypothetical protein
MKLPSRKLLWKPLTAFQIFLAILILATLFVCIRFGLRRGDDLKLPSDTLTALNFPSIPRAKSGVSQEILPLETRVQDRLYRSNGSQSLGLTRRSQSLPSGSPQDRSPDKAKSQDLVQEKETNPQEWEMIKKYDHLLRKDQQRIKDILDKYWAKYPIVQDFAEELNSLEDYLAVRERYEQDRDLYRWSRSIVQLQSIRDLLWKYVKKPEAWKVGILMSLEILSQLPPKPIYDEMIRVATTDEVVQNFIVEFWSHALRNIGHVTTQELPPDTDMSPIHRLIVELTPRPTRRGVQGLQPGVEENILYPQSPTGVRMRSSERKSR